LNQFRTERKAIYDTAGFFTECGWIFREQPIVDLGVDALVETPLDENGQIKIFALQIKGGESNFQRKKECLTFYFSERHYHYWNAISENYPLFIILQDNTEIIYWQEYNQNIISRTPKNWKLDIPNENILNKDTKQKIIDIIFKYQYFKLSTTLYPVSIQKHKEDKLIIYFSNSHRSKDTLHLNIEYKKDIITLDLFYKVKQKEWDREKSFLAWESQYHYSLLDFKKYIQQLFDTTNKSKLTFKKLGTDIDVIINGNIENVQAFIFDYNNKDNNIPKYLDFIKAFELHSKLKRGLYEAKSLGSLILFKTKKEIFEVSSYESLTVHLKSYIENYSYDEIYTETKEYIWSEIYIDAGIEKLKFIPVMQNELERYWQTLYNRIKEEIGHTEHLNESKEISWRMFKSFIELYDSVGSVIELAYNFDDMVLYPIAVISMMKIFNADVCYEEYCELEFYATDEWESICLDDENWDKPIFYIRLYEF
jgi:hypothetical protein